MNSREVRILAATTVCVAATILLLLGNQAGATVIDTVGTNPILDAEGGDIYFPVSSEASGELGSTTNWLGDPLGGGKRVGMNADQATLVGIGDMSAGFVTFMMTFSFAGQLGPGEVIDPDSAVLQLSFFDLDLNPDNMSNRVLYSEILTLNFLPDAGGLPTGTQLTLDENNYDDAAFGGGPPGFLTNQQTIVYEINMEDHLGLAQSDFDNMSADEEFALAVRVATNSEHLRDARDTIFKTDPENMGEGFRLIAQGVPEPGALVLLGLGGVGILLRRRRFLGR